MLLTSSFHFALVAVIRTTSKVGGPSTSSALPSLFRYDIVNRRMENLLRDPYLFRQYGFAYVDIKLDRD